MLRALRAALACALITLAVTGTARAAGGNYVIDGGTPIQQEEVRSALSASAFPWSVVPRQVQIHVGAGFTTQSTAGQIWIDASLLDMGSFSWALVQHEYGHQVDFLLFNDATRSALTRVLGGKAWCWGAGPDLDHAQYGCERFASTLAWSFWQSPDNALRPQGPNDESAALPPARFKALLGAVLRAESATEQLATIESFVGRAPTVTASPAVTSAPTLTPSPARIPAPAPAPAATVAATTVAAPVAARRPAAATGTRTPARRS